MVAWRRPDLLSHVKVFEVDHPSTQTWKRQRAAELGLPEHANHVFAPVDFGFFAAPLDRALWAAVSVFLLLAAKRGALKLAPEMRLPLAALLVAAVLMPYYANGSALADIRLPVTLPLSRTVPRARALRDCPNRDLGSLLWRYSRRWSY